MQEIMPIFRVFIVQVLTFILGMTFIWKLYIVPLRKHLAARREGIAKDLASAESAREEAGNLRVQLAAERERLAEDLKRAKDEARAEVAALRAELLAKAVEQQEALLKQARAQIEVESARAGAEVRSRAAELVVEATAALVGRKLDSAADRRLAERLVASVPPARR
jgi:F-type H+-transporting ATPase subunit b